MMPNWDKSFEAQSYQFALIKKLYEKNGLEIKMLSGACPEQYEVFIDGEQIAYYRLRNGEFRVDYPDCGGEIIYQIEANGDGIFDPDERLVQLAKAMGAVIKELNDLPFA